MIKSSASDLYHNEGEWARWLPELQRWSTPTRGNRTGTLEAHYREHFALNKGPPDSLICTTYDPTRGRPCGDKLPRAKDGSTMLAHLMERHPWLVARNDRVAVPPQAMTQRATVVADAVRAELPAAIGRPVAVRACATPSSTRVSFPADRGKRFWLADQVA